MAVASPTPRPSPFSELRVSNLGTIPYGEALAIQADVQARRQADELPDTLLLLEHPPVYTRGRRAGDGELALGEDFYRSRGIEIVPTDRGGKVTYHGPGQLVGYPIMRVTDIGAHLRRMEASIVVALADEGIEARSRCDEGIDYTGVWVEDRKIASIGVHVSRGVSTHGFAVNVTNDLTPFTWIVPCGLSDVTMTSVARERGHEPSGGLDAFAERVARCFCEAHGRHPLFVSRESIGVEQPDRRLAIA
ncbi:MAG TPA: lipoyl(octanoyl) transferase LipB [Solirubrobacteraceae bacterium]